MMERPDLLRSGVYTLDPETRRLQRGDSPVGISGRPLQLLELLLRAGDRVVTRLEIKLELWPDTEQIDTERRLNTTMRSLRSALGEDADLIETIRGHGYRWIGEPVVEVPRPLTLTESVPFLLSAAALITLVVALILLAGGSLTNTIDPSPLAPDLRARLVEINGIARREPRLALATLDELLRTHPSFTPARELKAEISMRVWREHPGPTTHAAVRRALDEVDLTDDEMAVMDAEFRLYGEWDWDGAERAYLQVILRSPEHTGARRGLAWLYLNAGRSDDAMAQLEVLLSEATLDDEQRADVGWMLLRMERVELALSMCEPTAQRNLHLNLSSCRHTALARLGDIAAARAVAVEILQALDAAMDTISMVRDTPPEIGYASFLEWRVDEFLARGDRWFQRAQLQAEAGDLGAALDSLERALAVRDPLLVKLRTTPEFQPLMDEPRFRAILRAVARGRSARR
jgi:DNA-binding winged helix-turn-helix (wHTH) protein